MIKFSFYNLARKITEVTLFFSLRPLGWHAQSHPDRITLIAWFRQCLPDCTAQALFPLFDQQVFCLDVL